MPNWNHALEVADVFHNADLSFEQIRNVIVERIRDAEWYKEYVANYFDGDMLEEIVDNLAETDTESAFNNWWDCFYDWADENRVWVATF
jgi:hypothetical protein